MQIYCPSSNKAVPAVIKGQIKTNEKKNEQPLGLFINLFVGD
jgi:hypothetical protein